MNMIKSLLAAHAAMLPDTILHFAFPITRVLPSSLNLSLTSCSCLPMEQSCSHEEALTYLSLYLNHRGIAIVVCGLNIDVGAVQRCL